MEARALEAQGSGAHAPDTVTATWRVHPFYAKGGAGSGCSENTVVGEAAPDAIRARMLAGCELPTATIVAAARAVAGADAHLLLGYLFALRDVCTAHG